MTTGYKRLFQKVCDAATFHISPTLSPLLLAKGGEELQEIDRRGLANSVLIDEARGYVTRKDGFGILFWKSGNELV